MDYTTLTSVMNDLFEQLGVEIPPEVTSKEVKTKPDCCDTLYAICTQLMEIDQKGHSLKSISMLEKEASSLTTTASLPEQIALKTKIDFLRRTSDSIRKELRASLMDVAAKLTALSNEV